MSSAWRPTTITVGDRSFSTTLEALTQFPGSQLARLFSQPFPIFDPVCDVHRMPPSLVDRPEVFSRILDFLRLGVTMRQPQQLPWPPMPQSDWLATSRACAVLGVPGPCLASLRAAASNSSSHESSRDSVNYDVVIVKTEARCDAVSPPRSLMPMIGGARPTTSPTARTSRRPLGTSQPPLRVDYSCDTEEQCRTLVNDLGRRGYAIINEAFDVATADDLGHDIAAQRGARLLWLQRMRPLTPLSRLVLSCAPMSVAAPPPLLPSSSWLECLLSSA